MSNINLLPWREASKRRQKRLFLGVLGIAAVLALSLVLLVDFIYKKAAENQERRNQYLQGEITQLDARIVEINKLKKRRSDLIERMQLIDRLQQSRNQAVHLYNDLPALVTTGVYLDSLAVKAGQVDVVGRTEAHSRVASMVRLIDKSGWLGQTSISSIFATAGADKDKGQTIALSQFSMMFKILSNDLAQSDATNQQESRQ